MSTKSGKKSIRMSIRVSEYEKEVITCAAKSLNTTVSSFVLERAYAEAQAVLANRRLTEKKLREFYKALDASPKEIPALRKLLTEPGIFDERY